MQLLIFENQIAGLFPDNGDTDNLPIGFTIEEYDGNLPIESLYFSDGEVKPIPPRPEGDYRWNGSEWAEIPAIALTPPTPIGPDWGGILSDLRGSELWQKTFEAASSSIAVNAAWTVLQSSLVSTHHAGDLEFSIGALRAAMRDAGGDFSRTEVRALNKILADRGFEFKAPTL
jgi:hypothetical protein